MVVIRILGFTMTVFMEIFGDDMTLWPNKSPEPTAVGACRSAVAVHAASRRWLSFFR
jgi:hypothetical protein